MRYLLAILFLLQTTIAQASLVSWWRMDEPSWNGTASEVKDSIGTNHGTAGGATHKPTTVVGHEQRAGSFDGVDDYISLSSNIVLGPNTTLEFWARAKNYATHGMLAASSTGSWDSFITFYLSEEWTDGITGEDDNGNPIDTTNLNLVPNTWYHMVLTCDGTNWKSYANGIGGSTSPYYTTVTVKYIGPGYGANKPMNGLIDEVRFYNHALTQAEITQAYWEGIHTRIR